MKATINQLKVSYNNTHSVWKTAKEFGMCGQSVHERLTKAGFINKMNTLSDEDTNYLIVNYNKYADAGKLAVLAKKLNRDKTYICMKAGEIGLTNTRRNNPWAEKHGYAQHPYYPIWQSMMARCYNEKYKAYKNYGARGIYVCEEWRNDPVAFIEWLKENGYKKGLTIDRIDNNGSYFPDNCRVATRREQANNRRNNICVFYKGKKITLSELAREHNLKPDTVINRYSNLGIRNINDLIKPV